MSRFWNKKTKSLCPYVAGEQPRPGDKVIKLNTNENPYPPSPEINAFLRSFDPSILRLYPDTSATEVREAFAGFFGVRASQIFCGNGSDEVLAFCFQAFFESGEGARPLFVPEISYSFYPVYADLYDIPLEKIPLNDDFSIPVEPFCRPSGGVAIANPNAPTTLALPISDIKKIISSHPDRVVLIDEAYIAFGGESCVELLAECPNLLIIGTLSKAHSLAGIRLGYAIASEEIIEGITRVRDSFNSYPVDALAQKISAIAIRDRAWYEKCTEKIVATREKTISELTALGYSILPSKTNFLFANPVKMPAAEVYKKFREKGILVRYFTKPRLCDYLRISIGSEEDMQAVVRTATEIFIEAGV